MVSIKNLFFVGVSCILAAQAMATNYAITFEYPKDGEYAKRIIGTVGTKLQKINKKSLGTDEQKFVNKRIGLMKSLPTWTDYTSTDLSPEQIKKEIGYLGMDKLTILEINAE